MSDATGSTSWTYDGFGHVLQKKQVTGAVTLTTSWAYDAATGRLTGMTYPSGYKILYTYDAGARVTKISLQAPGQAAATSFIDQIAYSPFGAVASWRLLPSGRTYLRDFDDDGRIASITSPTGNVLSYTYDAGSRISRIAESGRPDKSFFYDRNNRLKRYVNGASAINYGYDASGNRTADNVFSYAIAPTSNRIASRTPVGSSTAQAFYYDAAGGMESNGGFGLRYDERNRLDRVIVGALTTTYGVNGLGERVAKDGPPSSGKVEFVFDLSGGLLGQYNASGAAAEEIVWLGALPVGTIQGGAAYHIAADHLGAPHQIVNSANVSVWFWDHEPFGDGWPASAPGFTHRLRFPGQIYDLESNLHSNGHRDYDPRLGRYVESDPIGLKSGINTYAYANGNPVSKTDPSGLETIVITSGGISTNPFGHSALAFSSQGVYSYGTADPYGSSTTAYVQGQLANRDVTITKLNTTPDQEAQMANYYKNNYGRGSKYSAGSHNCANAAAGALSEAGAIGPIFGTHLMLPYDPQRWAARQPGAITQTLPQGGVLPPGLDAFNPQ